MRGGRASAASSIQPLALLLKSWIWAKPPSRPITRNGRPAGKPYRAGAEEDGLASTATGCLETRIMPDPCGSVCSAGSTVSPTCSTASPVCSACAFGAVAVSCAGGGVSGTADVAAADVRVWGMADVAAGGGEAATATGAFCSLGWLKY